MYDIETSKDAEGNVYQRFSEMIGFDEVRRIIMDAIDYAKADTLYSKAGVVLSGMTRHMISTGNPYTAKTT